MECFTSGAYSEDAEPSDQATLPQHGKRHLELPIWLFQAETVLGLPAAEPFGSDPERSWAEPID